MAFVVHWKDGFSCRIDGICYVSVWLLNVWRPGCLIELKLLDGLLLLDNPLFGSAHSDGNN